MRKGLAGHPGADVEARYGCVQTAVCAPGHVLPPDVENPETGRAANPSHTPQTSPSLPRRPGQIPGHAMKAHALRLLLLAALTPLSATRAATTVPATATLAYSIDLN